MANYLPVLLVSLSTNAVPDDSSLTTGPRGPVDYLSHDWEEEDVWRSWRNMTRQKNEIVNGVRLVYPMEDQAMRFANMVANHLFSFAFSWLLGQRVKDTLCGTKVLFRVDYEAIARNRDYFGEFDPFGDFDLLFGAAKMNLRIMDLPIRYQARSYGETNIQRWRHGLLLLRMVLFAATRLKFIQ